MWLKNKSKEILFLLKGNKIKYRIIYTQDQVICLKIFSIFFWNFTIKIYMCVQYIKIFTWLLDSMFI